MGVKIFITGVTGYIAGDATYALEKAHPEYEYTFLIRTQEKADAVHKVYPNARTVIGDLDSSDLLKAEAARADIVLHAADASDNEGAAHAIRDGLVSGHSKARPGFWLHTGGTGILTYTDTNNGRVGEYSDKLYDDWEGVGEVTNLPDEAWHRNVDKLVLKAGEEHGDVLKTAIICPPTIYGQGRGPVSTRGRQAYLLAQSILEHSSVPILGPGKARWFNVHVADLSDVYVKLAEAAAARKLDSELWNAKGYFFAEAGEHYWSELARNIGKKAVELGYIKSAEDKAWTKDQAEKQAGGEGVTWTTNSRARAIRARRLLGWSPSRPSLEETIPEILQGESQLLQSKT